MRFVVDEDVPKSATDYLAEREHEVTHTHDILLPGSADYLIARWAHENSATVVTCNVKHFKALLKRPIYSRAGLLGLPHQAVARARLERFIEVIEAEEGLSEAEGRVWVELRETTALIGR